MIIAGRNKERGENFAAEAEKEGYILNFIQCDVTDKESIKHLHNEIKEKYGEIDTLVSNAGMLLTADLESITDEDWDNMYAANVKSAMYICREFIEELKKNKGVILFLYFFNSHKLAPLSRKTGCSFIISSSFSVNPVLCNIFPKY